MKDYPKCIEHIGEAIELVPTSTEALSAMGRAKLANGQVLDAKAAFKQAMDINETPEIQDGLG